MASTQQGRWRWCSVERKISMGGIQAMACLLFALVLSAGCAETRHAMSVDKSGFMGDELYAKMTPGDESKLEAALRWINRDAIEKLTLTKIILDPIVMYRQPEHMGGATRTKTRRCC